MWRISTVFRSRRGSFYGFVARPFFQFSPFRVWIWMEATTEIQRISISFNNLNTWLIIAIIHKYNLSSCEIKAWKKKLPCRGFEPMTTAIPVQGSTNWVIKPTGSWSSCEFVIIILLDGEEYKWISLSAQFKHMIFHLFSFNNIDLKYLILVSATLKLLGVCSS